MKISEAIKKVDTYKPHKNQLRYDNMMENQYEFLSQIIFNLKPKTAIDIGCAYGTMTYWMKEKGIKVEALDNINLHSDKMFKDYEIPFYLKNIETDEIDKKYDLVVFTEVLEHLCYNPLPVMKKLSKTLNKDGHILLSTPAREMDPPQRRCRWTHYVNWRQIPEYKEYKGNDKHNHHYYIWELADLIAESELIIEALYRTKIGWTFILRKKALSL
jgi:2-polyprenyl-3-methyl-5-hydroxy-6-metoxy-1,4-benzoquinol methylase